MNSVSPCVPPFTAFLAAAKSRSSSAALQQLSLQIAESKHLKGVAAGGLVDDYWLDVLKLDPDDSKMALGFLCGK